MYFFRLKVWMNRIDKRDDSKSLEVRKFKYRKESIVAKLLIKVIFVLIV